MTNDAFVQRLADAGDRFLYTKMNEIDQFDALKGSARGKAQFQIMCLAFDPRNLLDLLPDVFTREEAQLLRQKMGMNKGGLSLMISIWKQRGYIQLLDEAMPQAELGQQRFGKTDLYLNKRKTEM